MKRFLLILSVVFVSAMSVFAQTVPNGTYYMSAQLTRVQNATDNDMRDISLQMTVNNDKTPFLINYGTGTLSGYDSAINLNSAKGEIYNYTQRPTKFVFNSTRTWRYWSFKWREDSSSSTNSYTINSNVAYIEKQTITRSNNNGEIMHRCNVSLDFTMLPTEISYYNDKNQSINYATPDLSFDSEIVVKATKNFPSNLYDWEYLTGGDPNSTSAAWKDVPTRLMNSNRDEIKFKGSDLFGSANAFALSWAANERVYIRVNAPTKQRQGQRPLFITFLPALSSPRFVSAVSAGFDADGMAQVRLNLDRALYTGETIEIYGGEDNFRLTSRVNLDGANYIILGGLESGTYTFKSSGKMLQSGSGEIKLYNQDAAHTIKYTVQPPSPPTPIFLRQKNVSVYGGTDGEITITASGGTGVFTGMLYLDGETDAVQETAFGVGQNCVFPGLAPGVYSVKVVDEMSGKSGEISTKITITQPPPPSIDIVVFTQGSSAWGESDGTITVEASGGTGSGYTAELYAGEDDSPVQQISLDGNEGVFEGLSAGDYRVLVTDDGSGSATVNVTISQPAPGGITVTTSKNDPSSPGGSDGSITVQASGGTGVFTAELYAGSSSSPIDQISLNGRGVFSGLSAGDYRVVVTDDLGGSAEVNVTITDPVPHGVSVSVSKKNVSAWGGSDGSITVRASGGSGGYTAELYADGSDTPLSQISVDVSGVFSGLSVGSYRVVVTDDSGESASANVTITQPQPPSIALSINQEDVSTWRGSDGAITVTASGGTGGFTAELFAIGSEEPLSQFSLSGSGVFDGLSAGEYSVVVTDSSGKSVSENVTITEPQMPPVEYGTSWADVSCHDGRDGLVAVSATGGSGSFIAEFFKSGEEDPLERREFESGEEVAFSGLAAGSYQVTITDASGLALNNSIVTTVINQPEEPVSVSVVEMVEPLAFESHDGEIIIKVSGGTPTDSGDYNAELTDENGRNYPPSSSFKDNGGAVHYRFMGLGRGEYSVRVLDDYFQYDDPQYRTTPCGCEAVTSVFLPAPPLLVVEIEETKSIKWYGALGELTAHGTGGVPFHEPAPYIYKWFRLEEGVKQSLSIPADSVARDLPAGVYQVQVTDKNGITKSSITHNLQQPDQLTVQFTTVETDCAGASTGSIEAFVSGGVPPYQYQWNVEGATESKVTSLDAGAYFFKVTDSFGGILTATVDVGSSTDMEVEQTVTQPTCTDPGGSIQLKISGAAAPYRVSWSDKTEAESADEGAVVSREELPPGEYKVEVADANGCRNSYSFTIDELEVFTVSLGKDLVLCHGQSRLVAVECDREKATFEWFLDGTKLPDTEDSITVDKTGEYSVIATTPDGCVASDAVEVKITDDVLELIMTVPTTIEVGSQIHAVNLSTMSADRIEWLLPQEAVIIEQSDTRLVFQIDTKGVYTIGMEGFKGEGSSLVTREIAVVGEGEVELHDTPLIKQFWVAPSPSTGYFKVMVELSRAEDFTMHLYSPSGVLMDSKEGREVVSKSYEYEIAGALQGTYLLHLETKVDKSVLQIVIKR